MENNMTSTTAFRSTTGTSGFAMPVGDRAFGCAPATSPVVEGTVIARDRQDAIKGHVGLAAYVPGNETWSPPPC